MIQGRTLRKKKKLCHVWRAKQRNSHRALSPFKTTLPMMPRVRKPLKLTTWLGGRWREPPGRFKKRRHRLCSRTATSESSGALRTLTAVLLAGWISPRKCLAKSRAEVPRTRSRYRAACLAMNASCAIAINCTRILIAVSWLTARILYVTLQTSPSEVIDYLVIISDCQPVVSCLS